MNRQAYIIAGYIFLFSAGGYMVMPLFPLLTDSHNISIVQAGSLTAFYIFFQMFLSVLSGQIGDKYGYRNISSIGELIRGISFIAIGFADEYILLLCFSILSGIGGGISTPSLQSLIMKNNHGGNLPKISSLRVTALSSGLILGPLLAGLIIDSGQIHSVFFTAGGLYVLGSILLLITIKPDDKKIRTLYNKINIQEIFKTFKNKPFLRLLIIMMLFYFIVSQVFVTFPEHAKSFTTQIQSVFLIYGLIGLSLQYPIGVIMSRLRCHSSVYMKIGALFLIVSYLVLFFIGDQKFGFYIAVIIFSFGPLFIIPIFESLVSAYSIKLNQTGLYFGVSRLSDGIGRPLGSLIGGWMYYTYEPKIFWLIFIFAGISLFILITFNFKKFSS
ncbi:MFS transporter [Corticicoccus populi]|uniref:MFS transporter n=1 Tax=Corticicoccus populi TaxID=1812821 RepID=A0ABW5WZ79_9STAP